MWYYLSSWNGLGRDYHPRDTKMWLPTCTRFSYVFHRLTNQSVEIFLLQLSPRTITLELVNVPMANLKINTVNVFIKMNAHVHSGIGSITYYNGFYVTSWLLRNITFWLFKSDHLYSNGEKVQMTQCKTCECVLGTWECSGRILNLRFMIGG